MINMNSKTDTNPGKENNMSNEGIIIKMNGGKNGFFFQAAPHKYAGARDFLTEKGARKWLANRGAVAGPVDDWTIIDPHSY